MRILDGDPLPAVVAPLGVEQAVYVATWRTGTWCAVLSRARDEHDDGREPPYSQDLDVYEHVEGAWVWRAGGGSSWPVNVGDAPSITEPAVTGFAFGMPAEMDERKRWLVSGIAPPGVGCVAVSVPGGEGVVAVEPASGAFLFAAATGDVQPEQLRPTP